MLQNTRVTAFTVSELLRQNQQGSKITLPPLPRLGLIYSTTNQRLENLQIRYLFNHSLVQIVNKPTKK